MNRDALNALDQTIAIARSRAVERVPVVGISGPQGSGKTTLVSAYASLHPAVAHFSLDDVYLGKAERQALARNVHPLFATRGPPGTHDMDLFDETIAALQAASAASQTALPLFEKFADDRAPRERWPIFGGRPILILVEGWCLGARPQEPNTLRTPANTLEEQEDEDGVWRRTANRRLADYQKSFDRLDAILCLRAPAFNVVFDWRCQPEEGLLGRPLDAADRSRISRFVAHYERITRHMMAGGRRADIEIQLDRRRNVTEVRALSG
jgi:D-glycerate 3-kinase